MYELKDVTNTNKDLLELVQQLDIDLNSRYGKQQSQYNQYNKLVSIDVAIVAYCNQIPVGCGCFKSYNEQTVEIKRMFVKPQFRGKGVSKIIHEELERKALEKGYRKLILETGMGQPEAIKFYNKLGYSRIENYDQYVGNDNSICMAKEINHNI